MAGLRVVRGPNWKWENQDGGLGHVGTTKDGKTTKNWFHVLWDNGSKNQYRIGADGAYDMLVLDNGPTGVHHKGVVCDSCSESNMRGIRWKCADCPDFDLCTECYGNDKHDMNHGFKRIDKPGSTPVLVGKRQGLSKIQARGIYKGAKVVRGDGWCKGDADGGSGKVGTVTKVGYKVESNDVISACVVDWPNGSTMALCLGWTGRVDVKCQTAAIGWSYYKEHLPKLGDTSVIAGTSTKVDTEEASEEDVADMFTKLLLASLTGNLSGLQAQHRERKAKTMSRFSEGDLVRLEEDVGKLQQLQQGHGGFNFMMIAACGKVGVVREIDDDGDLKVSFGAMNWCVNPDAVTKISIQQKPTLPPSTLPKPALPPRSNAEQAKPVSYKVGDRVVLTKDRESIVSLQRGHGGWNDGLTSLIGSGIAGQVKEIDGDGDLKVDFGDKSFILNPAVCTPAPTTARDNTGSGRRFGIGDRLNIDGDLDFVKRMQKGHGEWTPDMRKSVNRVGTVVGIDKDGDLRVDFDDEAWTLHPEVCTLVKAATSAPSKTPAIINKILNAEPEAVSVSKFSIGQQIKMDFDLDYVKRKLNKTTGWKDAMRKVMNKVGTVTSIKKNGVVNVSFGDVAFDLHEDVCHSASEMNRPWAPKLAPKPAAATFTQGDHVKIGVTEDRLKALQQGHGGWNDTMLKSIGEVGVVEFIDSDGDVKVKFTAGSWAFNPAACLKVDSTKTKETNNADAQAAHVEQPRNNNNDTSRNTSTFECAVCKTASISVIFECGHGACEDCSKKLNKCHICRNAIGMKTKIFI